jgi:hypothetical protein
VVKVAEDPVYATPVFTTMGGQSKCPGEAGTSRRESNVQIMQIIHRCGKTLDLPCDETTLTDTNMLALFGVVILNNSPTSKGQLCMHYIT